VVSAMFLSRQVGSSYQLLQCLGIFLPCCCDSSRVGSANTTMPNTRTRGLTPATSAIMHSRWVAYIMHQQAAWGPDRILLQLASGLRQHKVRQHNALKCGFCGAVALRKCDLVWCSLLTKLFPYSYTSGRAP
jgi:hypothetical protein